MEEVGTGVLEESHVVQLQRLAAARNRFLAEFPTLTSQEIAALNGSRASNSAPLANRWKAAGKIFALNVARRSVPGLPARGGREAAPGDRPDP